MLLRLSAITPVCQNKKCPLVLSFDQSRTYVASWRYVRSSRKIEITGHTPGDRSPMKISATKLRENIYAIVDEMARTGIPVEIERKAERRIC